MRYDRFFLQKKGIPHLPGNWEFRELEDKKKWILKNYPEIMNTHGGPGRGQGRKSKFNEETTTLSVRVPVSKKEELKNIVDAKLEEWSQGGI